MKKLIASFVFTLTTLSSFSQVDSLIFQANAVSVGEVEPYLYTGTHDSSKVVFNITYTFNDPDPEIFVNSSLVMSLKNVISPYMDSLYLDSGDVVEFTVPHDNPSYDGTFKMDFSVYIKVDTTSIDTSNVGISKYKKTFDLNLHPNPTTNYINVNSVYWDRGIMFEILNLSGQSIHKGVLTNQIFVSDLPKGVYIIQLNLDKTLIKSKFIKS